MAKKEAKTHEWNHCCSGRFPTFATTLLVVGIIWLLNELKIIAVEIPWAPVVLILIATGILVNRYNRKC